MPLHDWTCVSAGTYHDFHNSWITHLKEALNEGLLPPPYYALGEQRSGDIGPDVLALREVNDDQDAEPRVSADSAEAGLIAVAEAPPQVFLSQETLSEAAFYLAKRRTLVIRHASGDRVVALVEILSPANKHGRATLADFVDKVLAALRDGIHVLVIDPFPPGRHDPQGIHGLIWEELLEPSYQRPADRPRTLVSYRADTHITAYVEPIDIGSVLKEMPLFLTRDHYICTPLEATYGQAWAGVPQRWRRVIEANGLPAKDNENGTAAAE